MINSGVFVNGKIFTSSDAMPYAEAMVIEGGVIKWIGKSDELPESDFPVTDLDGRRVMPGLVDAHMHAGMLAEQSSQIACLPPNMFSIEELITEIKSVRQNQGRSKWIQGWGYDEGKMREKRIITRYDLDRACDDAPVVIMRTCAHILIVNSAALELAGISRNTPDPQGGQIDRDESGEPTGILRENAKELISRIMPVMSDEEMVSNILDIGRLLASQGITSATDMGSLEGKDHYANFKKAEAAGFKQRMGLYYIWDFFRDNCDVLSEGLKTCSSDKIRIAGLKLIGDGSVSGRTAWMDRPYRGSENEYGMPVYSDDLVESAIEFCKENRCQLAVHAMGARAVKRIVDRVCREECWTDNGVPFARVEHVTDPMEESIEKAAGKGIYFVTQPNFFYAEIESYIMNLGFPWIKKTYPVKHMLEKGVKVALSTDAPATAWAIPSDPWTCIRAAVTRKAYDGTDCGKGEAVDIETAVRLYTKCSAEAAGFKETGQLKAGFQADFIILENDILEENPAETDELKVLRTYIGGECVYMRK